MTQADRKALQAMVRNAARRASRNPRPDQPNLAEQLEQVGLDHLDQYTGQINDQLDAGESAFSVAKTLYGVVITHMFTWRQSDNAAYWAGR